MKIDKMPFRGPCSFLGLPDESTYDEARAVILPVPYDGTTSYRSGTRDGPMSILLASRNVELYDQELHSEPLNSGIFTLPEVEPTMTGPEAMIRQVEKIVDIMLADNKFPVMLGGEHSLTTAPVRALKKQMKREFSVLQLDAHADLRDSFENTKYSHASVMRRVIDIVPIVQVGIRNISKGEAEYVKQRRHDSIFWAKDLQGPTRDWIPRIVGHLGKKVYITIDLDVFDPSIMPAVGTPEPGGMLWYPVLELLEEVIRTREIIGLDIVELCPQPGNIAPDFLAAKLLFKILGRLFTENGWVGGSKRR
jgi:agmatinase